VFSAAGVLRGRRMDWRAGIWAPLWLAGLALFSYLSSYGGTGTIGLGWGFVVNLVWAAVIYVLALKVRLPGARVREIIEETAHDEVDEADATPRPASSASA
jgi:hypothetical protein